MDQHPNKLSLLDKKLEALINQQAQLSADIRTLQHELTAIKTQENTETEKAISIPESDTLVENISETKSSIQPPVQAVAPAQNIVKPVAEKAKPQKSKNNFSFERFIGENLINKIGIIILIIGVAIGSKYAIENQLLTQSTRVIIGYLLGTGLLLLAIKLKKKFEAFSAVLLSGALAIFYFITYAAYAFYDIIPLNFTFILLLIFTAFTIFASINYNRQIIAHIGLVGAYAIPILLSTNSGNITFLLSYVTLINVGILIIAINRYWKALYISAFSLTWLLMLIWRFSDYNADEHFALTTTFILVFFVLFFVTFLIYKLVRKVDFQIIDITLIIANSFLFFGLGYSILTNHSEYEQYTGLFTLLTALLHFLFSLAVYKSKMADRNLMFLIAGLVLTFLTITFPVQLDGSWVTLLWACETALLFWIGRSKSVRFYEYLSYALVLLTFSSIAQDWMGIYSKSNEMPTFVNISFFTSLIVMASFTFVFFFNRIKKYRDAHIVSNSAQKAMSAITPILLLIVAYFAIYLELAAYWNKLYASSEITLLTTGEDPYPYSEWNTDIKSFKKIWLINFTLLFLSAISLLNAALKNSASFCWVNQGINLLAFPICFSLGLWEISELRESYLSQELAQYYQYDFMNLAIRYISLLFLVTYVLSMRRLHIYLEKKLTKLFDFFVASAILWYFSSELLHWLDINEAASSYKLAISIYWGVYALALVVFGIWKQKAHIRIMAFALLGVTLIKMFFYDLSHLNTLSKSIIFISIGILMLGISFLYNKFKDRLIDDATH